MATVKTWALRLRVTSLQLAESFDAWRVIPRLVLVAYSYLVWNLYLWYRAIPTYVESTCNPVVMELLLERGLELSAVTKLACTVSDVVGGPTTAQTTLVTALIGLSAAIFGLYANTGRKWAENTPPVSVDALKAVEAAAPASASPPTKPRVMKPKSNGPEI